MSGTFTLLKLQAYPFVTITAVPSSNYCLQYLKLTDNIDQWPIFIGCEQFDDVRHQVASHVKVLATSSKAMHSTVGSFNQ